MSPRRGAAPPAAPKLQEDEIMRSIAHLDALIASIHARGAAREQRRVTPPSSAGSSAAARAAAYGAHGAGAHGVRTPGGGSGAASSPGGARDVRHLLSASTRALLGLH
jgi:hypothetical protein